MLPSAICLYHDPFCSSLQLRETGAISQWASSYLFRLPLIVSCSPAPSVLSLTIRDGVFRAGSRILGFPQVTFRAGHDQVAHSPGIG